jgi:hypothetical protein
MIISPKRRRAVLPFIAHSLRLAGIDEGEEWQGREAKKKTDLFSE